MSLSLEQFTDWLERYFRAWQSNHADDVAALFAEDAIYYYGPFKTPAVGRQQIVANWMADPEQQTQVEYNFTPLAIIENLGFAHWHVLYRSGKKPSVATEMDGILVLTFDAQGRCTEHREWYSSREVG